MKRVFQTDWSNTTGNCLQACVASLCELPLEDIPQFITFENWKEEYVRFWLSREKVVGFHYVLSDENLQLFCRQINYEGFCILAVQSFLHKDKLHAVVGQIRNNQLEIVFDPNPLNQERTADEYYVAEIDLFY